MSTFYSKNKAYRDVNEDEYIFNALKNYPAWAKSKLPPDELKIFKSDSTIRTFVNHGTVERKNALLAKAGIQYVKIYIDTNKEEPFPLTKFSKLEKQFRDPKERAAIVKSIIEHNMFATSSREILSNLYLIAQNCHNPYYFVNLDYKRTFDAIENVQMKNLVRFDGKTDTEKIREAEQSRTVVANFFLALIESDNYMRVHLKMDQMDVNILLFLFIYRDTHVTMAAIYRTLFNYAKKSVRTRMSKLSIRGYVVAHRDGNNHTYTIAELGIMAMCELLEKSCHKALTL